MAEGMAARLFIGLYTDADVDQELARQLRRRGFDAMSAREVNNYLLTDNEQLEFAITQRRAILSHNTADWAPLYDEYWNAGKAHYGIVVSEQLPLRALLRRVLKLLDTVTADEMINNIKNLGEFAER
jgi:hypothetical protein